MKLYTYWRSQAAFRVRAALGLKGLQAELIPLDIIRGDQHSADYAAMNPQRAVPTLIEDDGHRLVQSLAILVNRISRHHRLPNGIGNICCANLP